MKTYSPIFDQNAPALTQPTKPVLSVNFHDSDTHELDFVKDYAWLGTLYIDDNQVITTPFSKDKIKFIPGLRWQDIEMEVLHKLWQVTTPENRNATHEVFRDILVSVYCQETAKMVRAFYANNLNAGYKTFLTCGIDGFVDYLLDPFYKKFLKHVTTQLNNR